MNVKSFIIRINTDHGESDENNLNEFLNRVVVVKTYCQFVNGDNPFWSIVAFYKNEVKESIESTKKMANPDSELSSEEFQLLEKLKNWRREKAISNAIPNYMVCTNSELISLVKIKPTSIDDLIQIKGFGLQKSSNYGEDILEIINSDVSTPPF